LILSTWHVVLTPDLHMTVTYAAMQFVEGTRNVTGTEKNQERLLNC